MVTGAAGAAASKKADRILVLDVSEQLGITDYFLICSANTERQVRAIAEAVERALAVRDGVKPYRREGEREGRWVLLDYVDFVVHVFHQEERDYFSLERLWSDAPQVNVDFDLEGSDEPAAAEAT
ncbi:MAG: ribosome silencing factor [Actinomycetota bacterium]|nr:ribosome silencing factor [Actinomycetota bacterium]